MASEACWEARGLCQKNILTSLFVLLLEDVIKIKKKF
jgi:hypothetical protein